MSSSNVGSTQVAPYSGERFDPQHANALAHYDHHARYQFVMRSLGGGRLLDVGCGLGVSSATLAPAFDSVLGIDADASAIAEANRARARAGLSFKTVDEYLRSPGEQFDVVTCLEVIEHTTAQKELLELLKRAVKPGGVVVVTTPNRQWTQLKKISNPFHVKELLADEFYGLVESVFPHVQRWSQLQTQGACIVSTPSDEAAVTYSRPAAIPTAWQAHEVTNFVAICSSAPRKAASAVSILDAGCTFQVELEGVIASNERMIDERDALLRKQDEHIAALNASLGAQRALEDQVRRLKRLEELPDADALPLRWKLADRANGALKSTPLHALIKRASELLK